MGRWALLAGASFACVCCVLPAYESSRDRPGQPAGGGSGGAGGSRGGNLNSGGAVAEAGSPTTTEVPCPTGVLGHCEAGATYPSYEGYSLALVEDFPAPLDLDEDPIFTWSDGAIATGQTGFRRENIGFVDGEMRITAESSCPASTNNSECYPARMSFAEAQDPARQAEVAAKGVWSGELRSRYNNYRYGRYEVKLAAPVANPGFEGTSDQAGGFTTMLFVFRTPSNLSWNEIDLEVQGSAHDRAFGSVANAVGASSYPDDQSVSFDLVPGGSYAIYDEHVYAFNWTPEKIEWFVDGQKLAETSGADGAPIPTSSAKIMMSLWIFDGPNFGDGANNRFPFSAAFDYFRFYRLDSEPFYPCPNPPACLPDPDKTASSQNNPNEVDYGQ